MRESSKKVLSLIFGSLFIALLSGYGWDHAVAYEGFGATTPGGSGGEVVHVTNLDDSGPGSLRDALSEGNRTVVFDVGGEILLSSAIRVTGAFITIDGFSAPSPGITLRGAGLSLFGTNGAHDIIIQGIRIRDASALSSTDGITIAYGAYNIVVDHVSIAGSIDGNIDITFDSHDVTVSWSILAGSGKNMLIKYNPSRVTLHHNIFTENLTRSPEVRIDQAGTPATDTTLDMRNNLIWDWDNGYGTFVWYGPQVNIVNNVYSSPGSLATDREEALIVCKAGSKQSACQDPLSYAQAYLDGNFSADGLGVKINSGGNASTPFPAPPVDAEDACSAANKVLADAGVRPLDLADQQYLSLISLSTCVADLWVSSLSAPGSAKVGSVISVTDSTKNAGPAPTGPSITSFYFSTNNTYGPGDTLLNSRTVPALDPGERNSASTSVTVPMGTPAGTYFILAVADANNDMTESNESNNLNYRSIAIGPDLIVSALSAPRTAGAGSSISVSDTIKNQGADTAAASTTKFYHSTNRTYNSGDVFLGSRMVPSLAPGATSPGSTPVNIPSGIKAGTYYIIAVADGDGVVPESTESNNTKPKAIGIP